MRHVSALILAALIATACESATGPVDEPGPTFLAQQISDAGHEGQSGFYFLPPMVKKASYSGTFDGSLSPTVRVYHNAALVAELAVTVSPDDEHYFARLNTRVPGMDPGNVYRLQVEVGQTVLGWADLALVGKGSARKAVNSEEYIPVKEGRTLPVKFRIEVGAVPTGWTQLAATGSGPAPTGFAGGRIDATYAPELDAIFVVRYMGDGATGELWTFDLATRSWTVIPTTGWPRGKYRHYEFDPQAQEIVTFWDGLGDVYAVPVAGGAWYRRVGAGQGQSFYVGSWFYDRNQSRFSHAFGYGLSTVKNAVHYLTTTGWVQEPLTNSPRPRVSWCNYTGGSDGRYAFFGGGEAGGVLWDDLWALDLVDRQWIALMPERSTGMRHCPALTQVSGLDEIYRFGGQVPGAAPYDDLQVFDPGAPGGPTWTSLAIPGPLPPARLAAHMFFDSTRGELLLVGGIVGDGFTPNWSWITDVWTLRIR